MSYSYSNIYILVKVPVNKTVCEMQYSKSRSSQLKIRPTDFQHSNIKELKRSQRRILKSNLTRLKHEENSTLEIVLYQWYEMKWETVNNVY